MARIALRTTTGGPVTVPEDALTALRTGLRGQVVQPSDIEYDEVRAVWNGLIDKRPGLTVRCAGVADVVASVTFARERDLLVAVGGGHDHVGGLAVSEEGFVIDLARMRGVRVDPVTQTVRVEGGVTLGELDRETQAFGLAVPTGNVSTIGIAGLTLGGGLGWLRRMYGLSCDNLRSADVVTADGRLITASAETDSDLLWALKGGGGNFGVVTSFEFQAHPVGPEVFLAFVVHHGDDAGAALRFFREWSATAPDEISAFATLSHIPEIDEITAEHHHTPGVAYVAVHCGDVADGADVLQPLREFGTPLADLSTTMPYVDVQRFLDADFPANERHFWRSRYLKDLTDEAIDVLMELNEANPSLRSTLDVWQLGGRMSRVAPDETAFGDRSAPYLISVESNWENQDDDAQCVAWAREAYAKLEPFSTSGEYTNFHGPSDNSAEMVQRTFGTNLDRLRAVKQRYDPTNLFRVNHNIDPG